MQNPNYTTLYAKLPLFDPWIHRAPLEVHSCRDPKRQRCRPQARPSVRQTVNQWHQHMLKHSRTSDTFRHFGGRTNCLKLYTVLGADDLSTSHIKGMVDLKEAGCHEVRVAKVALAVLNRRVAWSAILFSSWKCKKLLICCLHEGFHVDLSPNVPDFVAKLLPQTPSNAPSDNIMKAYAHLHSQPHLQSSVPGPPAVCLATALTDFQVPNRRSCS